MVSASEKRYAVALLFDISEAFDNVWWPLVLDSLKRRECPRNIFEVLQSYFDGRKVKISFSSAEVSKRMSPDYAHIRSDTNTIGYEII